MSKNSKIQSIIISNINAFTSDRFYLSQNFSTEIPPNYQVQYITEGEFKRGLRLFANGSINNGLINNHEILLYFKEGFGLGFIFTDNKLYWYMPIKHENNIVGKIGIEYNKIKDVDVSSNSLKINSMTFTFNENFLHAGDLNQLFKLLKLIKNELEMEKKLEAECKRKLELAKNYETSLRYEDAASIYEEMDMWGEAGRIRQLAQKATTSQISGDKIHIGEKKTVHFTNIDDHSVSDSVIQRSTIDGGISQKKISICPYCGEKLNFPETPRFCPYCEKQILM